MTRFLALVALLTVTACASVEPVYLRDPKTGQIVTCSSNAGGGLFPLVNAWTAQHEIDTCAAAYQRMGYVKQ
jgi:hypothetical protein